MKKELSNLGLCLYSTVLIGLIGLGGCAASRTGLEERTRITKELEKGTENKKLEEKSQRESKRLEEKTQEEIFMRLNYVDKEIYEEYKKHEPDISVLELYKKYEKYVPDISLLDYQRLMLQGIYIPIHIDNDIVRLISPNMIDARKKMGYDVPLKKVRSEDHLIIEMTCKGQKNLLAYLCAYIKKEDKSIWKNMCTNAIIYAINNNAKLVSINHITPSMALTSKETVGEVRTTFSIYERAEPEKKEREPEKKEREKQIEKGIDGMVI